MKPAMTTTLIMVITATLTALIAGLFYAYTCSVNTGLGKLGDEAYIAAMQSINKEIINPLFFASFMGTLFLLPLSAWLQHKAGASSAFLLLLAASAVYVSGTFGVIIFGNVPLNNALARFDLHTATAAAMKQQRALFEPAWNRLHTIRTIAAVVALVLVIVACLNIPGKQ